MKIIPVIDILNKKVVHGIRGKRNQYKPIKSTLTNFCYPLEVAKVFKEKLGLENLYIADLDSIEKRGDNFDIIKEVENKLGIKIILDPGIRDSKDLDREIVHIVDSIILGTETLTSVQTINDSISIKGRDNVIVSIDLKGKKFISNIEDFKNPEYLIRKLYDELGLRNFILLDLEKVGSMEGVSEQLTQLILSMRDMDLYLITGGGIRSMEDIIDVHKLGIEAVLIATALHAGKIAKEELEFLSQI